MGHDFAQNLERIAASVMGHPGTTEAVMQQGTFSDEDQRRTTADGVATILLAMSGADETAGTGDDYVVNLVYGGISNDASCDLSMSFTNMTGLAFCSVGGAFIASDFGTTHARITTAFMEFGVDFDWFFNQEGPCRQTFDLTKMQWKQIALSCDPGGSNIVADLFGDDLSGGYDVDWVVFERDAVNDVYVKMTLTDTLEVGRGYWIITNLESQTVNIEEDFNSGNADFFLEADPTTGRFNMVGHPYWYDMDWADVRVVDGLSELTLSQADPGGGCQSNPPAGDCVMSRIAYKYNGSAHESFDGETLGMEGTLKNFDGLWVKAYKPGIALRFLDRRSTPVVPFSEVLVGLPEGGGTAIVADVELETVPPGWFIRLTAKSGSLKDSGSVFGQLSDSVERYDSHDLIKLPPFGNESLEVVFPKNHWGARSGDYASDFRSLNRSEKRYKWFFDVRSAVGIEVTLTWDGPPDRISRGRLFDMTTGKRVRIKSGSYTFTTQSTRHSFRWIQKRARGQRATPVSDPREFSHLIELGRGLLHREGPQAPYPRRVLEAVRHRLQDSPAPLQYTNDRFR